MLMPSPTHPMATSERAARERSVAAPPDGQGSGAPASPAVLRSEDVLCGQRSVEILHAGGRYRLSVTALGKLILTK